MIVLFHLFDDSYIYRSQVYKYQKIDFLKYILQDN